MQAMFRFDLVRSTFVLVATWLLGLLALGVVIGLQHRVDETRHAQVVIAQMRNQQGALVAIAFDPATSGAADALGSQQTTARLGNARRVFEGSIATLAGYSNSGAPARIAAASRGYYGLVDRLAALVKNGSSQEAALMLGRSERPGGAQARLTAELDDADARYGAEAERSRQEGMIGTVLAIVFLLSSFSVAFEHSVRARRRCHLDATTDALTGLPNRRSLFTDTEKLRHKLEPGESLALGMLDLDGFKVYNDTFGHPAGDALLARLGQRLAAAIEGKGTAYRMGGDEFCVIARGDDAEAVLEKARAALCEQSDRFSVSCTLGSVLVAENETTLEQALCAADQRLYNNKRSPRRGSGGEAHDVLLRVLSENSHSLAAHVSEVGRLAEAVARKLGLSEDDVTLARLTAELHDVGKTAIPNAILDKPGPLDAGEWAFMRRHTIIGERILAAAPALARVAPLVRSTHERTDGDGYPDGLRAEEIPLISRIVAVVDAYDAMTSRRTYSLPLSPDQALDELRRCSGSQFDPTVTEAFLDVCKEAFEATQPPRRRVRVLDVA